MEKTLIWIGLALVALWIILSVTKAVVGGALWLLFIVGVIALAIGAFRAFSRQRHASP